MYSENTLLNMVVHSNGSQEDAQILEKTLLSIN